MNITEAFKLHHTVRHESGKASAVQFPAFGFSLLTVGEKCYVIQELHDGIAINGKSYDEQQAQAFVVRLIQQTGISFAHGWRPLSPQSSNQGKFAGIIGTCLIVYLLIRRVFHH